MAGSRPPSDQGIYRLAKLRRHSNLILMLTTLGGSPDTAYRMARCLRKTYHDGKFVVFVDTLCKSAGTLITLAADELVMSDNAHLGPLDIQVPEKEEVGEMSSGLTPTQALTTLKMEAWRLFDDHFARLRYRPGFRFSTKMAGQIAARMTIGLLRPIYEQIDPMRLGENERSLRIAAEYGQRLASKNLKDRALARLVSGYPSHTFAIDRHEAKELFNNVREPTKEESALAASLDFLAEIGQDADERGDPATIYSISDIVYKSEQARIKDGEPNEQGHTRTDRVGARRAADQRMSRLLDRATKPPQPPQPVVPPSTESEQPRQIDKAKIRSLLIGSR